MKTLFSLLTVLILSFPTALWPSPWAVQGSKNGSRCLAGQPPADDQKPSTSSPGKVGRASMKSARDQAYRNLLGSLNELEAVLRQQPHNAPALERKRAALQTRLQALRETLDDPPAVPPPGSSKTTGESKVAKGVVPKGPVTPSDVASPPGEAAKRREATEDRTYRPDPRFPPDAGTAGKTLAGVPEKALREGCARIGAKLTDLANLLQASPLDAKAISETVQQVHALVHGLELPSGKPAPVIPRKPPEKQ